MIPKITRATTTEPTIKPICFEANVVEAVETCDPRVEVELINPTLDELSLNEDETKILDVVLIKVAEVTTAFPLNDPEPLVGMKKPPPIVDMYFGRPGWSPITVAESWGAGPPSTILNNSPLAPMVALRFIMLTDHLSLLYQTNSSL